MLKIFEIDSHIKEKLKNSVEQMGNDFNFEEDSLLAELVACLGIVQEIGTLNDELNRHIFDKESEKRVSLASMRAEIVTWKGRFGVKVYSTESSDLSLVHSQLRYLLHPNFSWNSKGELHQLVFFPKTISNILSLQQIELVIVKDWALNTVFGRFSPQEHFYVTNEWEVRQNDGLKMARLISEKKLAFFGTHDLVAHVAGANGFYWNQLKKLSDKIIPVLSHLDKKSIVHLILPYIMGVLLDDLAQPAHYGSEPRLKTILHLAKLQKWLVQKVPKKKVLKRFPETFVSLIEEPRQSNFTNQRLKVLTDKLTLELQVFAA